MSLHSFKKEEEEKKKLSQQKSAHFKNNIFFESFLAFSQLKQLSKIVEYLTNIQNWIPPPLSILTLLMLK